MTVDDHRRHEARAHGARVADRVQLHRRRLECEQLGALVGRVAVQVDEDVAARLGE